MSHLPGSPGWKFLPTMVQVTGVKPRRRESCHSAGTPLDLRLSCSSRSFLRGSSPALSSAALAPLLRSYSFTDSPRSVL